MNQDKFEKIVEEAENIIRKNIKAFLFKDGTSQLTPEGYSIALQGEYATACEIIDKLLIPSPSLTEGEVEKISRDEATQFAECLGYDSRERLIAINAYQAGYKVSQSKQEVK